MTPQANLRPVFSSGKSSGKTAATMRGQVYTKICGLVLRFERRSRTAHVSRDLWFGEFGQLGLGDLGGLANKIAGSSSLDHPAGGFAKDGVLTLAWRESFAVRVRLFWELKCFLLVFRAFYDVKRWFHLRRAK